MNEVGDLRPSQLIFTFGVGAVLDLPNLSGLILGLDDWDTRYLGAENEIPFAFFILVLLSPLASTDLFN